jgi:hypothetical protein
MKSTEGRPEQETGIHELPKRLPIEDLRRICDLHADLELLGRGLGVHGFSFRQGQEDGLSELTMLVDHGMPEEFKIILAAAVTEIQVNFRELPEDIYSHNPFKPSLII